MENYRQDVTLGDWMGSHAKRLRHQERRPQLRSASDFMGPGLGPRAVLLLDWNDDATLFNGFFYSGPGALNSPDPLVWWMGQSLADPTGCGFQLVRQFMTGGDVTVAKVRGFIGHDPGTRTFDQWVDA